MKTSLWKRNRRKYFKKYYKENQDRIKARIPIIIKNID